MTVTTQGTLVDTLDELRTLIRDGARPAEAQARFRVLRERHPEADLDLVWEEEAYDGSVHYDAILSLPGEGTVSLSVCPDRALPWPLRGVHRWSDADLVRFNTTVLKVEQAIAFLDFMWDESRIIDRLVNICLIRDELERDPIELPAALLQEAVDGFRRAKRLYTAADTYRWLERHGMTQQKLEEYVGGQAIVNMLRERVAAGRVDQYFESHGSDFDRAYIARVDFSDEGHATRVYEQIRDGEDSLYDAARQRFLKMAERPTRQASETFAVIRRGEAPTELAAAVFRAAPGALLPPIRTGEGYAVVQVLAVSPACLDGPTRLTIEQILFQEWLDERRRSARIEWFWGNAARTSDTGRQLDAKQTEDLLEEAAR